MKVCGKNWDSAKKTRQLRIQLCTKYLGFGDGETYPFESDHGTQLNGTIVEGNTQRKKLNT